MHSERVSLELDGPLDLRGTWSPLSANFGDPTLRIERDRVVRATRTPPGAASFELLHEGDRVHDPARCSSTGCCAPRR